MREKRRRKPAPGQTPVLPVDAPSDVASVMALVRADFWKLRAQMLIYHHEVVAELDSLYETLYGTPPREPGKKSPSRNRLK